MSQKSLWGESAIRRIYPYRQDFFAVIQRSSSRFSLLGSINFTQIWYTNLIFINNFNVSLIIFYSEEEDGIKNLDVQKITLDILIVFTYPNSNTHTHKNKNKVYCCLANIRQCYSCDRYLLTSNTVCYLHKVLV